MKSLIFFTALLFYCSLGVQSQPIDTTFTQQEFFSVVLKYHPVAKQADINIEKANADLLIARGGFDPLASALVAQKTFDGIDYYETVQPELRIPTWYGVELVVGAEYLAGDRTNNDQTLGATSYAGVVIPVAKNLLMDKRRAALQTAKIFVNLSEVEKRSILNDLLFDAANAYWQWALQYEQYKVITNAIALNEKRLALIRTSFRQGDRPALDTIEALTQLQSFQYQQQEALLEFNNAALDLSVFLWQQDNKSYALPTNVVPANYWLTENITESKLPVLDDLLLQANFSHPDLLFYNFKLDALNVEKKLKFQELLPKLDFKYNQLGKGYNIFTAKSGPLFTNNFKYGVVFSMPLRLSQGRGEYQKAKLKIAETSLERDLKTAMVQNKIKSYFNKLLALLAQTEILEKAFLNFGTLQRGEELKFFNGESSLFLVNTRENKTLEARQKFLKTKADYYKTFNLLQWSAGILR